MKKLIKNNWISLLAVALVLTWSCLQSLPDLVPVHFDLHGNADRFDSKYLALFLIPGICVLLLFLIPLLIKASPKSFSASQSDSGISKLLLIVVGFLLMVHVGMIKEALEPHQWIAKIMPLSLSLLTVLLGNYLGKIEKNFVVGIRVPWTLASEENWTKTHRFAGKLYVGMGLLSLLINLFYPNTLTAIFVLFFCSIAGALYSLYYYRSVELKKISQ